MRLQSGVMPVVRRGVHAATYGNTRRRRLVCETCESCHRRRETNRCGCVPGELYLWTPTVPSDFHMACNSILLLISLDYLKM